MNLLTIWMLVYFVQLRIAKVKFLVQCQEISTSSCVYIPVICVMKTTPVASVIILLLMWISSGNLSVCIVFLMTFPILYTKLLEGLQHLNPKLNEMAEVFELPVWVRLRWIGIPQLMPYIKAGCALGIGLAWKAGTAAEVIGISGGTIGEMLYQAKIYLETADLLAWTVMILVLSYVFEKLFLRMLDMAGERAEKNADIRIQKSRIREKIYQKKDKQHSRILCWIT